MVSLRTGRLISTLCQLKRTKDNPILSDLVSEASLSSVSIRATNHVCMRCGCDFLRMCGDYVTALPTAGGTRPPCGVRLTAGMCGDSIVQFHMQTCSLRIWSFFFLRMRSRRTGTAQGETRRGRQRTERRSPTASSNRGKMSLCVTGADQNRLLPRPVPPSVAQTRGSEGPQTNVRPRRGKGKLMPMHALRAHALSGDLCVAGADQNRLLRRPVPPFVAHNFPLPRVFFYESASQARFFRSAWLEK